MKKALRVLVDGTVEELDLDSAEGSLKVLQNGVKFDEHDVSPLVQAIDISDDLTMWCHEEGKILGHPHNDTGSLIFRGKFGGLDYIVGNIVLTGGVDDEGDTLGIPEGQVEGLRRLAYTVWDIKNK